MRSLPSPDETAELLAFADVLADEARGVIMPYFRSALAIENKAKGGYDPVTEADKGAELAMRRLIEERFPTHGILGEEHGDRKAQGPFTWVLDPIDGTRSFVAGLPVWGTLIGLLHEGEPLIGVIDQGFTGERFRGFPGGASLTDRAGTRAVTARSCERIADAVIATTDAALFSGPESPAYESIRREARLARYGCDCYAYAMVALGTIDLVVETALAPWDVAALVPVVAGAGGHVSDWAGLPLSHEGWLTTRGTRTQLLATGAGAVHTEALARLRPAVLPKAR
ncbi:MAG: histidinol-phosphatase [Myxococcales bacterium]|nr:histidinol-phosphatase [Myxococcales bacterium]